MLCGREKKTLIFYEAPDMQKSVFWDEQAYIFKTEIDALELIMKAIAARLCSELSYDDDAIEIWSIADSTLPIRDPRIRQICITSPGESRLGATAGHIKHWVKTNMATTLANASM